MIRRVQTFFLVCFLIVSAFALLNRANAKPVAAGAIVGKVVDSRTGAGIGWANVVIMDTYHGVSSHSNGEFHIFMVPPGKYTIKASHLGFRDKLKMVEVAEGDTAIVEFFLNPSTIQLREVTLSGVRDDSISSLDNDPAIKLSGRELQRELGLTIAETVDESPGIAQRSMGPAPARPVLRGLSGDRLMILEDNKRTGDLSATSSDHAVAIDPMTANDVEVIRGAETLLFGPGAIGGVINVNRRIIPMGNIHRFQGSASLQSESVNEGTSFGINICTPVKHLALKMDGSYRRASDIQTPVGTLSNTDIQTTNAGVGLSLPRSWGVIGVSGKSYDSEYGIPGGFVGAHPNGVSIEMNRRNLELMTRIYPATPQIRQVEVSYSFARYYHAEWESDGNLGMEFGVLMDNLDVKTHLDKHFVFDQGVFGAWGELRNYATGGLSFTPETREKQVGVYLYEQKKMGILQSKYAIRFDSKEVIPEREFTSVVIGHVRKRSFSGLSSAVSFELPLYRDTYFGTNIIRSWRAPTVEELFSRGPHLAAYSYEIGNPDLDAERGLGLEVFLDGRLSSLNGRLTLFRNSFSDYIFPSFSGKLSAARADLYEYYYKGRDAMMTGMEANLDWDLTPSWNLHGVLSYVRGELSERNVPMPLMPPLGGKLGMMYRFNGWTFNIDALGAFEQDRLYVAEDPDAIPEDETSSWLRFDISVQMQKPWKGLLHVAVLSVDNLTDTEYRNHLSRVKVIMPEPGRNVKLTYKVYI